MTWRRRILAVAPLLLVLACGGGDAPPPAQGLNACADTPCLERELAAIVGAADDPSAAVDGIVDAAYEDPGSALLANCHGIMHTVGREYAVRTQLRLAGLMDAMPRNNDPACAAGFAHGLVTGLAPEIERAGPDAAERACAEAGTRFQRYSCTHGFGHAFMRVYDGERGPALDLCRALGAATAPDCAQGVYHDYWFAVEGLDGTTAPPGAVTDPRALCAGEPDAFVPACWYRGFIEIYGDEHPTRSAQDIERFCADLGRVQRRACVTAAIVVGPADPREQLAICRTVRAADVASCIRGTKVQNLLTKPEAMQAVLIADCARFRASSTCYRLLGKALGVITDGRFEQTGCPRILRPAARKACVDGVRSMDGPLGTFS